ncbi:MAG: efflux RND transporter periplasmic adaptor subunit [Minisyncoccia bacterium]
MNIPQTTDLFSKGKAVLSRTVAFARVHTKKSLVLLALLLLGGYYYYSKSATAETRYTFTKVEKGTLVASVTGTGQVTALNQIDVKPRVSGELVSLPVKSGATVRAGQVLATIDARDARKALRDAQTSLEIARLDLKQLMEPNDSLAYLQAQNAIKNAEQQKTDADRTVATSYRALLNSSFEALPDVFLNEQVAPTITGTYTGEKEGEIIILATGSTGSSARFEASGLVSGYGTVNTSAQPMGTSGLYIQFPSSTINNPAISLGGMRWIVKIPNTKSSSYLSNNTAYQNAVLNRDKAYKDAEQTIAEQKQKISDLKAGATPLEIESKNLSIRQRQNALYDAQLALNDYTITAPFGGTITSVPVQRGESVSSGTTLATLITKKRVASVTMNEVDVARIKIGQKTTLTFDALEDFSVAGEVLEIETVGTVTQGVVSYVVKVGFDADDEKIKPGMSVTANIVTDVKQDVLLVPSSSVKTKNGASFVEVFATPLPAPAEGETGSVSKVAPEQKNVEIGISSDTQVEIVLGLIEGEEIVAKTISATSAKTTTAPSLFPSPSGRGGR